ncbi:hypothetical protein ACFWNO_48565, partial [Streptomyces sp. NPDC058394]
SAATTGTAVAATAVQTAGTSSAATAQAAAPAEQDGWPTHTVTGDSELPWDLAEQYLGSGPRWKDIAALNPSVPQLAAGDQFLPKGTVIRLPADANIANPATPAPAPAQAAPETAAPTTTAPAPAQDGQKADTAQQPQDTNEALAPAAVWTGAGALAAALIGTLATRRILQQRRRRPGRRIPMPTGSAAATEQSLRAAQHPTGFDLLDAALRTLALNLAAAERDLPVLTAVVLHEQKVELHLDSDVPPMKPFSGSAGRTDLWTCPASSPDLADHEALQGADAPYPALVSLGWDGSGRLVLVDLEYVGVLHLDGDADHARHVLQAIAVELASTPLPGHLEITALADTAPGLDDAAPERVARTDTHLDQLRTHGPHGPVWWRFGHSDWQPITEAL